MTQALGALGARRVAEVDEHGSVHLPEGDARVRWWIGADDRWHRPEHEVAVRQARLGVAPAYETSMRVPGGDVVDRAYAVGGAGTPVVLELENRSPGPVVVALVTERRGGARVDGANVHVGDARLELPRLPSHVLLTDDLADAAVQLDAGTKPVVATRVSAPVITALLPVAHRTRLRAALLLDGRHDHRVDLAAQPSALAAVRGWELVLERGMRVAVDDAPEQLEIDRARVDLLLEVAAAPSAAGFRALEDWGFDDEATRAWRRLGWRARREAARSQPVGGSRATVLLGATREALVREAPCSAVAIVPVPPVAGRTIEVHDAPTRRGVVSFALRWHGARVALLWDAEPRDRDDAMRLVAPGLDPRWSTTEPTGEVLFEPDLR